MIIKETYVSPNSSTPLIKIFSDKNFFLQYQGQIYSEVIVSSEEEANKYSETTIAIPAPIADEYFICKTLINNYQNLTQKQILDSRAILNKALKSLTDEEAYMIKFLYEEWAYTNKYYEGDRVLYNNDLYNVIQTPLNDANPALNKDCYKKIKTPPDLVEEWHINNKRIYNIGDRTRVGEYVYESLIDNNMWGPKDFPDAWELIEGSQA